MLAIKLWVYDAQNIVQLIENLFMFRLERRETLKQDKILNINKVAKYIQTEKYISW